MLELTRKESTKKLIGILKLKMAFYAMEDAGRYVSLVLSFHDTPKEKMQNLDFHKLRINYYKSRPEA